MGRISSKTEFEGSLLNVNTQSVNSAIKQVDGADLIDYVKADFVGDDIPFTPTGNLTAITAEDAIIELDLYTFNSSLKHAYFF